MKKKAVLLATLTLSACLVTTTVVLSSKGGTLGFAKDETYWYHYERVEPGEFTHGSKEFWANCSTHNYTLENPGVHEDIREGVAFNTTTYFAELDSDDPRYIPSKAERVDIKGYFSSLLESLNYDPYSYIPNSMRPDGVSKVSPSSVDYDFTNFTDVSSIHYGGFGEQWHMVIENIHQSELFYNITHFGSEILGVSNLLITSFLDDYYEGTIDKVFDEDTRYVSKINYEAGVLNYTIQFLTGVNIPLFGEINPQIDMGYVVESNTKTARIQLGENNAMKFVISPSSYTFALEYGIETISRKAMFTVAKDEEEKIEGHIFEFVQLKGKDVVNSCADFYIDEEYTSVVGNKADGLVGLKGYINELYTTENGALRGYEIRETRSLVTYNTLWFNMNNVSGFTNVKALPKESYKDNENPHQIYINGESEIFEPTYNTKLGVKTSRKYDIELRTQYFYGIVDEEIVEYETHIPMMFIQAGENYETYSSDILSKSGITSVVSNSYLEKIEDDYAILIDLFIDNKDNVSSQTIVDYIGNPAII